MQESNPQISFDSLNVSLSLKKPDCIQKLKTLSLVSKDDLSKLIPHQQTDVSRSGNLQLVVGH